MFKLLGILIIQLYFIFSSANFSTTTSITYQKTSSVEDSIARYKALAATSYREGDLEGFKKSTNEILVIAKRHNLIEFKIRALINLAIYDQRKDRYDEALVKYIKAKESASHLKDSSYLKIILNTNLGNCYNGMKDYDNAKITMENVLKLAEYHNDKKKNIIKIAAFNALAFAASDQNKHSEAFNYYDQIKEILKGQKENENKLAVVHLNIAACYREIGKYDEALINGQKALQIIGQEKYIETEASVKLEIGASYFGLGNYSKAIAFLKSSNKIADEDGFLLIKMETHKYLAEVYEVTQNINEALKEHKEYTSARDEYLKTLTNAQRLKFENESKNKLKKIDNQRNVIDFLNQKKGIYLAVGFTLIVLFLILVTSYYKKREVYKNDTSLLKNDNSFLENENELLRDKLNRLALTLQDVGRVNEEKMKRKSSLSLKDQEFYKEKILNHMEASRLYLDSEIKQIDVAKELDISSHRLSEILATCFEQNFNSFINLYRINEAKLLMKNPKYRNYKIIALAYESGFSSKPSFNRVFKNLVGCTPSEFQKKNLPN